MKPSSLYIHVPFCANKCDYCAFFSVTDTSPLLRERYLKKIETSLEESSPSQTHLKTIFIGGSNPTFLPPEEMKQLLSSIRKSFDYEDNYEFTV